MKDVCPDDSTSAARVKALTPRAVGLGVAALAAIPSNAATFNVTNLNDAGAGSLRDALVQANTNAGADVVTFQPGLSGTITLTTGQLYITDSVDIQGPGAAVITVSGNNSSRVFYLYDSSATLDVTIQDLTVTGGNASTGAGIIDFDENLTLDGVTITGNDATGDGGGLWADGFNMTLTIRDSTISGNTSGDDGGGMYVEDTGGLLLIENSIISGNDAAGKGGGAYFYDPDNDLAIRGTTISGNTAATLGGGVYLYSHDSGEFMIEQSTISGNSAVAGGGAYLYSPDHGGHILSSTISGNQATSGDGGGVTLYNFYNFTVDFVTIASNTATGNGGGLFVNSGDLPVTNSIIADNTAGLDNDLATAGAGVDLAFSLVESPGAAAINDLGNNIFNTDPQLGALANNGGLTQTHRPALTSPVVNVADPATIVATDQRGQPREYPVIADMGALELVGGVIQFNPNTATVAENGGSVNLTVVRDVGPDPASVDFTTNPGTATAGAGNDYTTNAGTLNFAAGDLSETITVAILDDNAIEGSEQFTATLSNPSIDATLGANAVNTVTITDFEPGELVLSSATYSVGEQGASLLITVNRINGSDGAISVNYTTANGSATAGSDYTTTGGTLNWADGDSVAKTFSIPILDDSAVEGNEDFAVSLNTPGGGAAVGTPASATVTITDDPAGTAQFTVSSVNTQEEAGSVTLTVTRTGGTEGPLSVNFATADGTATSPADFTSAASIVTFPAGDATPQAINITLIDDAVIESPENFTVTLTGANVGSPSTVSILLAAGDIEAVPTVSFFGKLFFGLISAITALYVLARKGSSAFLLGAFLLTVAASTPALAAKPHGNAQRHAAEKESKADKYKGTLASITREGDNLTIQLKDGSSVSVPANKVRVIDARSGARRHSALEAVTEGANVIVRVQKDKSGNVKSARIKLTK